jgi:glycosyltransferase involved in cell wall biosynthesis
MLTHQREALSPPHHSRVRSALKACIRALGKGDAKVAAVFGADAEACHTAAAYLAAGAPGIPLWLFTTSMPRPETAALCERITIRTSSAALLFEAQAQLWRRSVAICAGAWTGSGGSWLLKLAPLLVPPGRAVFLNECGDFLPGRPAPIAAHLKRRIRDAAKSAARRAGDYWNFLWDLLTYHIWRSGPCTRVKDVAGAARDAAGAVSLRIAATLLKLCGYPDRQLFHRMHGQAPLYAPDVRATGSGIAVYRQTGPQWDAGGFERFARTTAARWILWRQGEGAAPEELFEPFEDGGCFAASAQEHFRAWDPGLFATAPIRELQRGEASQVLAPLSGAILVDRHKLLALGIPACRFASTAWMILFWKAAAAGWRSFSVGCGLPVSRQPDMPMQERAFIWRVLRDPSLRQLGPCEPDLSRGTVASAPAASRAVRDLPRVLVVSPFLPYPQSHGGAVRIFNLCRGLADRVDFALVAIHEHGETVRYDKLGEVFREIRVVDADEFPSPDRGLPEQVRRTQSRSLRAAIEDLDANWRPDVLQVEYTHMAAFRQSAPSVPAILVEHDLTFHLYGQVADAQGTQEARLEYARWLEFERRWLAAYDAVWTVSEKDRLGAIAEGAGADRAFSIPNGVDVFHFLPSAAQPAPPEILFVGSFRHFPNVLAFQALRDEVMPRVRHRFPEAVARVVAGPDHLAHWRRFAGGEELGAGQGILVHGFVEDLRPLYERATVVAAPMEVSAGTNIKMLEAMACGKPIVATPTACGGLGMRDGHEALIREDWAGLADAACEILSDPALRRRLSLEARLTAERRFSWTAIQEQAYLSYLDLIDRPAAARAAGD